jgi:hypothetical protein
MVVKPRRHDSANHVVVSIEPSHYRRNRPELQSLDVVPAMRQASVTFLPQVLGLPFISKAAGGFLPDRRRAVAIGLPQIGDGGHEALARIALSPVG